MPAKQSATGNERPERVFLIDSMSHIFRAFYAPMQNRAAPLATSQGQVTQAVYIFTNMLIKLLREEKPDYIAAIFESGEKTFRLIRSEEHTSELQSHLNLVCRLLLE